jgi:hypothetical protein
MDLGGDMRRYVLVIFAFNLAWFYNVDPSWTEDRLLSVLCRDDEYDKDAFWAGFLWAAKIPNANLYGRLKAELLSLPTRPHPSRRSNVDVLSAIILAGWGGNSTTGVKYVSNEELRTLLLNVGDDFRSRTLWHIGQWAKSREEKGKLSWADLLPAFLRDVWPRQIAAKSGEISARLFDLAFSTKERFPEIAAIVRPLLTKFDGEHMSLPELRQSKDTIVDRFPRDTLALLDAVLPDSATRWPYGIETTIQRIGEADPQLNSDPRLVSLRRRWGAR